MELAQIKTIETTIKYLQNYKNSDRLKPLGCFHDRVDTLYKSLVSAWILHLSPQASSFYEVNFK